MGPAGRMGAEGTPSLPLLKKYMYVAWFCLASKWGGFWRGSPSVKWFGQKVNDIQCLLIRVVRSVLPARSVSPCVLVRYSMCAKSISRVEHDALRVVYFLFFTHDVYHAMDFLSLIILVQSEIQTNMSSTLLNS